MSDHSDVSTCFQLIIISFLQIRLVASCLFLFMVLFRNTITLFWGINYARVWVGLGHIITIRPYDYCLKRWDITCLGLGSGSDKIFYRLSGTRQVRSVLCCNSGWVWTGTKNLDQSHLHREQYNVWVQCFLCCLYLRFTLKEHSNV